MIIKYSRFRSITLFGVELPNPLQMNVQLRKLHLLIQHFMILQLRHTTLITQSLKEIHSGRETGLIDTGPFGSILHNGLEEYVVQRISKWLTHLGYRNETFLANLNRLVAQMPYSKV